jgi:oligopeptide transport system substrate-binding protein
MNSTALTVLPPLLLLAVAIAWVFLRSRPDLRKPATVRAIRFAAAIVVLLNAAAAFALFQRATVETPADFRFINRGELTTLDPNRMSWMQDIRTGYALWEGLYAVDPVTCDPVPGAAERIETSADQLTWTFHLRTNGKWTNGDPVTAQDFIFAWRRMLEQPGDYTYLISKTIKGADAYSKAAVEYIAAYAKYRAEVMEAQRTGQVSSATAPTPPKFESVGVASPDPQTLVIRLEHPVAIIPDLAAFPPYFPLNEKSMKPFIDPDTDAEDALAAGKPAPPPLQPPDMVPVYDKRFTRPPGLVTNGPYRLQKWDFKKKVRLVANEFYWDAANVKSKTIDIISAEDPMAQFLIYNSKRVDWLTEVSPELASDLKKQGRTDLKVFPAFGTYFYCFNCLPKLPSGDPNPFADARVRKALTMAIDKRPIVENVTRMGEQITTDYIPHGVFPGYQSPAGLKFDREGARRLLEVAGYPGGRGFPKVSFLFNTGAHHAEVAQIVRRQWLDELGIDISLEGVEVNAFRQRLHNQDYAVCRASWYGDYNDPSTFTDKFLSDGDNNDGKWVNEKFDQLCKQAAVAKSNDERLKLFAEAEGIMLDDAAILPMYHYVNTYLVDDKLKGIPLNVRNMVNFKSVWKEK